MQERFSLCWAADYSLNISSTFAGVNNLSKHPAARCLTRKTEPKNHNCYYIATTARDGIQNLIITEGLKCFFIAGSASAGESPAKTCSHLSVMLIPWSLHSPLGVNESCTNIFTCQEAPLHFSSVHFSWWGARSRCFCGDYCEFSLCWLVTFTIQ